MNFYRIILYSSLILFSCVVLNPMRKFADMSAHISFHALFFIQLRSQGGGPNALNTINFAKFSLSSNRMPLPYYYSRCRKLHNITGIQSSWAPFLAMPLYLGSSRSDNRHSIYGKQVEVLLINQKYYFIEPLN